MSDTTDTVQDTRQKPGISLEYDLDEPPQKVWRAITVPEWRDRWLPDGTLADGKPASITPDEEVSYRMREPAPPYLESTVTFRIAANAEGGTRLHILHRLDDAAPVRTVPTAANANGPPMMRAA